MSSSERHSVIPIVSEDAVRQRRRQQVKGRVVHPDAVEQIRHLLEDSPRRPDLLIEFLHRIQDHYQQLSTAHLAALARELKLSQTEVFEVASFYHHFDVVQEDTPENACMNRITVRVCEGLSCDMAGSSLLLKSVANRSGAHVRVIPTPCVGRCEQAPVAVVGQYPIHSKGKVSDTCVAVEAAIQRGETQHIQHPDIDISAYLAQGGYRLFQACRQGDFTVEEVIQTLTNSGLRGMGGAGFPAGRKWQIMRQQPSPRMMAVNIDEGEPGTFKDRNCLEKNPHQFLEGMLIAAWAVEAERIVIYLRDEYHGIRHMLAHELEQLRSMATLDLLPAIELPVIELPVIELRRGAGAYICGEESAMLESIEGKRGMPRLRPPYVAERGLFNLPTLVHNLETLYWIPEILGQQHGGHTASFAHSGRRGRKGLRSFSVSGRVRKPGVHMAPAGITLQELLDEHCGGMLEGQTFYAYLPGGASGGILPARLADIPLDFDTLQAYGCFIGSAAIVVLSDLDRAVDAARNLLRFFKHESCGQCTPCRVGTHQMLTLIERDVWDLPSLQALSQVMRDASICGLGQAAPNPVDCIIQYFPHELIQSEGPKGDAQVKVLK